ncbi:DUF4124 domain-containing protein [Pseudomonadota bacterium]
MIWTDNQSLFTGMWSIIFGLLGLLTFESVTAQMCKWIDENGVSHYAEQCPKGIEGEQLILDKSPSKQRQAEAARRSEGLLKNSSANKIESQLQSPFFDNPSTRHSRKKTTFTLADVRCPTAYTFKRIKNMEIQCEQARERNIAPFRDAEITNCIKAQNKSPEECEKFHANYLNSDEPPTPGISGRRVFDNLPECQTFYYCRYEAGLDKEWESRKP